MVFAIRVRVCVWIISLTRSICYIWTCDRSMCRSARNTVYMVIWGLRSMYKAMVVVVVFVYGRFILTFVWCCFCCCFIHFLLTILFRFRLIYYRFCVYLFTLENGGKGVSVFIRSWLWLLFMLLFVVYVLRQSFIVCMIICVLWWIVNSCWWLVFFGKVSM